MMANQCRDPLIFKKFKNTYDKWVGESLLRGFAINNEKYGCDKN